MWHQWRNVQSVNNVNFQMGGFETQRIFETHRPRGVTAVLTPNCHLRGREAACYSNPGNRVCSSTGQRSSWEMMGQPEIHLTGRSRWGRVLPEPHHLLQKWTSLKSPLLPHLFTHLFSQRRSLCPPALTSPQPSMTFRHSKWPPCLSLSSPGW